MLKKYIMVITQYEFEKERVPEVASGPGGHL